MTIALSLKSKGGFLSLIDFWFISLEKSTHIRENLMHRTCTIKSSEQNKYFDVCLVLIFIRFIIIVVLEMF